MNVGFPYYWYGVYALDADNVVISGFDNQQAAASCAGAMTAAAPGPTTSC